MKLKKIEIFNYRKFENIEIDFENNSHSSVYSIASINGGGKSTILQFIFILLHCFIDKDRKVYIKNILESISESEKRQKIVKFTIEKNNTEYYLEYFTEQSKSDLGNFDLYIDMEDIEEKIKKNSTEQKDNKRLINLQKEIEDSLRVTSFINHEFRSINFRRYIRDKHSDALYRRARESEEISDYKNLFNAIFDRNKISDNTNDYKIVHEETKARLDDLEFDLVLQKIKYITHINENKNVCLIKTDAPQNILNELTGKVFLTAPISQVFLFLSKEDKDAIFQEFSSENQHFNSYYDHVRNAKKNLSGFYTYDFASTELILQSFKRASEEDLKSKRKTGTYGSNYDQLTTELKDFLDGKEITENVEGNQVIFKLKENGKELSPEDLSHGELKKLGVYIWLKYIVDNESIILMDEVDIALHPKWQFQLVNDFARWSKNSQHLLATHSPQILSTTHYKNIIKLENGQVKRFNNPPIDRDINAIITEIMGTPHFPVELLVKHKEYRELINKGEADSKEAVKLKGEILEHESESSSFFQEINFDIELMKE